MERPPEPSSLCAGASAFVRPARTYGIILAGYTAVMLALPSSTGAESAQGLFADRVLCTLVGVLVSAAVTGILTPRERLESLDAHLRGLGDDVFAFAHAVRTAPITPDVLARQRHLVARIGQLGERADQVVTGLLGARRRRRKLRRALRALFAASDSARGWVTQICLGSVCGGAAAVLYVLLLPLARTPLETALLATPFLLIGAWAMARPLTAKMAVDFNMVFLMATPPAFTLQGGVRDTVGRAMAVVVGVLAATIFFHATHEAPPRRLARLARGALRDLRRIAASADAGEARLRRGVLADRVVRMAAAAESDPGLARPAEAAVDLLALGAALTRLVPLRRVGAPAGAAEGPVASALARVRADVHHPAVCAEALERAAELLDWVRVALAGGGRRPVPPRRRAHPAPRACAVRAVSQTCAAARAWVTLLPRGPPTP